MIYCAFYYNTHYNIYSIIIEIVREKDDNEALGSGGGWHIYEDHNVAWYYSKVNEHKQPLFRNVYVKCENECWQKARLIELGKEGEVAIYWMLKLWISFTCPQWKPGINHKLPRHFPFPLLFQSANANRSEIMLAKWWFPFRGGFCLSLLSRNRSFHHRIFKLIGHTAFPRLPQLYRLSLFFISFVHLRWQKMSNL